MYPLRKMRTGWQVCIYIYNIYFFFYRFQEAVLTGEDKALRSEYANNVRSSLSSICIHTPTANEIHFKILMTFMLPVAF